jgi:hypothetical protein
MKETFSKPTCIHHTMLNHECKLERPKSGSQRSECKPIMGVSNSQRFKDVVLKRSPVNVGPGSYNITTRAIEHLGHHRRGDLGIQRFQFDRFAGKETGENGFYYVGNSIQFDPEFYHFN